MRTCPRCGTPLDDHMKYCYECGTRQTGTRDGQVPPYYQGERYEDRVAGKSFGVAALLSLVFPGLGHAYLGVFRRGAGFTAFAAVLVFMIAITVGMQITVAGEVLWFTVAVPLFMAVLVYALCVNDCRMLIKSAEEADGLLSTDSLGRL